MITICFVDSSCSRIHRPADSLFSWSSGFNNFGGFVNWGFLLLFLGGSRLFLENIIKYGVRIDPFQWFYLIIGDYPTYYIPSSLILIICMPFGFNQLFQILTRVDLCNNVLMLIYRCKCAYHDGPFDRKGIGITLPKAQAWSYCSSKLN